MRQRRSTRTKEDIPRPNERKRRIVVDIFKRAPGLIHSETQRRRESQRAQRPKVMDGKKVTQARSTDVSDQDPAREFGRPLIENGTSLLFSSKRRGIDQHWRRVPTADTNTAHSLGWPEAQGERVGVRIPGKARNRREITREEEKNRRRGRIEGRQEREVKKSE